jgi:hypothetical protein
VNSVVRILVTDYINFAQTLYKRCRYSHLSFGRSKSYEYFENVHIHIYSYILKFSDYIQIQIFNFPNLRNILRFVPHYAGFKIIISQLQLILLYFYNRQFGEAEYTRTSHIL